MRDPQVTLGSSKGTFLHRKSLMTEDLKIYNNNKDIKHCHTLVSTLKNDKWSLGESLASLALILKHLYTKVHIANNTYGLPCRGLALNTHVDKVKLETGLETALQP